jgi:phosphoribosylanthranilate isomerase
LFRIKICGVTSAKDAQLVALAGADAVGLNFYPQSPRYIDLSMAEKIVGVLPKQMARVGIFVNPNPDEAVAVAERLKLDWIQLHGEEPAEMMGRFGNHRVLRAFRFGNDSEQAIVDYLDDCQRRETRVAAILIDAAATGELGGTGKLVDWNALVAARPKFGDIPLVLAGGLTPFNVAEAIALTRPDAVDVASGVESKPGSKDLLLLRAFITSAKKAFAAL